jgi:hypothetical protein
MREFLEHIDVYLRVIYLPHQVVYVFVLQQYEYFKKQEIMRNEIDSPIPWWIL